MPGNFHSKDTIQHSLGKNDIPGICLIDTRALIKILRERGTMNSMWTAFREALIKTIIQKNMYKIKKN